MTNIRINKDEQFIHSLEEKIENQKIQSNWQQFKLYSQARIQLIPSTNTLNCLQYLPNITLLPHHIQTCKQELQQLNERALLLDEVAYDNAIEAACIIKEMMNNRTIKKALTLVPATLVNQWVQELTEKFLIPVTIYHKNMNWEAADIVVTSLDLAKRANHRAEIEKIPYDLLIVDEAHKLRNPKTINYQFVQSIQKKYCLLLTATPIQNRLTDMYHLITIVNPSYIGNLNSVLKQNKKVPTKNEYMKTLLKGVIVRHTRNQIDLTSSARFIQTIELQFDQST